MRRFSSPGDRPTDRPKRRRLLIIRPASSRPRARRRPSIRPSARRPRARDLCARTYSPRASVASRRVTSRRVASRRASPRESSIIASRVSADAWMGVAPLPRLSRSRSRPPSRARFRPRELRLDASRSRVDLDDLARASNERLARRRRRPAAVWGKTYVRAREGRGHGRDSGASHDRRWAHADVWLVNHERCRHR